MKELSNRSIKPNEIILNALKQMDVIDKKLLIVLDQNHFLGLLSAGDIQRAIIKNISLNTPIREILRPNIRVAHPEMPFEEIKAIMLQYRMELCPVVSKEGELLTVHFWEDLFKDEQANEPAAIDLPVVVMAGGFGTRMRPLTHVIPKPLIPLGEHSILEEIFIRFAKHACNRFYLSVNYKADMIAYYLDSKALPYEISYFREKEPRGTAGSLSLLRGQLNKTFFVTNCDILIADDYAEMLNYHQQNNNEITIIAALKHFPIAYGTIETGENGLLAALTEKPELTFKINSGMYILEPHLLDEIPDAGVFHITHLIENVRKRNGRVGVYPVSEKSWVDIGNWEEYSKYIH
jgi:dTDP-glucose pyrophosphorylase